MLHTLINIMKNIGLYKGRFKKTYYIKDNILIEIIEGVDADE